MGFRCLGHANKGATHQRSIIRDLGCLGKPGRVPGRVRRRVARRARVPRRIPAATPSRAPRLAETHALRASRRGRWLSADAAARGLLPQDGAADVVNSREALQERHAVAGRCADAAAPVARRVRPSPVELLRVARCRDGIPPSLRDGASPVRVRAGVYAPRADVGPRSTPWERYLARVHAFALVTRTRSSRTSPPPRCSGFRIFGEPRDIHIYEPDRRTTSRRFGDVFVHTRRDDARASIAAAASSMTTPARRPPSI